MYILTINRIRTVFIREHNPMHMCDVIVGGRCIITLFNTSCYDKYLYKFYLMADRQLMTFNHRGLKTNIPYDSVQI